MHNVSAYAHQVTPMPPGNHAMLLLNAIPPKQKKSKDPNLPRNSIAQLHRDSRPCQDMYPQSLRIAQSIVLGLDLCEHDFFPCWMPEEEIWDAASSLAVFLRHLLLQEQ